MSKTKLRQRRKASAEKRSSEEDETATTGARPRVTPVRAPNCRVVPGYAFALAILLSCALLLLLLFAPWGWSEKKHTTSTTHLGNKTTGNATKTEATVADYTSSKTIQSSVQQEQQQKKKEEYTVYGSYELLETVPHDRTAFTQGLLTTSKNADDDDDELDSAVWMYEGTGLHGNSELRLLDIPTGNVLAKHKLPRAYFGEGIAHYRDKTSSNGDVNETLRLLQLTWQERTAFEYEMQHFRMKNEADRTLGMVSAPVANWTYRTTTTEGWGVTYSATHHQFYVTDGSHYLLVWDADTKQPVRKVAVVTRTIRESHDTTATTTAGARYDEKRMSHLNELEWDPSTDTVLANVWIQDVILRIDPISGLVRTVYDLSTLFPERPPGTDVLNGIALTYDSLSTSARKSVRTDTDQVWVTGKYWPHMYRIRLVDPS